MELNILAGRKIGTATAKVSGDIDHRLQLITIQFPGYKFHPQHQILGCIIFVMQLLRIQPVVFHPVDGVGIYRLTAGRIAGQIIQNIEATLLPFEALNPLCFGFVYHE